MEEPPFDLPRDSAPPADTKPVAGYDGLCSGWSWFSDPRAIGVRGKAVIGSAGCDGNWYVTEHHEGQRRSTLLDRSDRPNDHGVPSFLRRQADGRIMVFYTGHNVDELNVRISIASDDVSGWLPPAEIGRQIGLMTYCYTNPIQLIGEEGQTIYLFFRARVAPSVDWGP